MNRHQKTMSPARLMREFTTGDEMSWSSERMNLVAIHPRRLDRIRSEISSGFFPPVRLDYNEKRVIDGHHRVIAAEQLGIQRVPVADAWDGSDWYLFASDQGGDDPVTEGSS